MKREELGESCTNRSSTPCVGQKERKAGNAQPLRQNLTAAFVQRSDMLGGRKGNPKVSEASKQMLDTSHRLSLDEERSGKGIMRG